MKNLVFAILMGVFFTSCGGSMTETTPSNDSSMSNIDSKGTPWPSADTTCCVDTIKK